MHVAVAYFEDSDSVDRSRRALAAIRRRRSEALGFDVTDEDIDDLVRTSGNYLYWWSGTNPTHESDVESCMNP